METGRKPDRSQVEVETSSETPYAPLSLEQALEASQAPEPTPQAATGATSRAHEATKTTTLTPTRTWTPNRTNPNGSTTIVMKRACNGCGHRLGDVTDQEIARGINGLPLPDVRKECPYCAPTAPEPVCWPMQIVTGDALCVEMECDHSNGGGSCSTPPDSYCDEVAEEVICATHSEITNAGEIVQAEPWPCRHAKAVTG